MADKKSFLDRLARGTREAFTIEPKTIREQPFFRDPVGYLPTAIKGIPEVAGSAVTSLAGMIGAVPVAAYGAYKARRGKGAETFAGVHSSVMERMTFQPRSEAARSLQETMGFMGESVSEGIVELGEDEARTGELIASGKTTAGAVSARKTAKLIIPQAIAAAFGVRGPRIGKRIGQKYKEADRKAFESRIAMAADRLKRKRTEAELKKMDPDEIRAELDRRAEAESEVIQSDIQVKEGTIGKDKFKKTFGSMIGLNAVVKNLDRKDFEKYFGSKEADKRYGPASEVQVKTVSMSRKKFEKPYAFGKFQGTDLKALDKDIPITKEALETLSPTLAQHAVIANGKLDMGATYAAVKQGELATAIKRKATVKKLTPDVPAPLTTSTKAKLMERLKKDMPAPLTDKQSQARDTMERHEIFKEDTPRTEETKDTPSTVIDMSSIFTKGRSMDDVVKDLDMHVQERVASNVGRTEAPKTRADVEDTPSSFDVLTGELIPRAAGKVDPSEVELAQVQASTEALTALENYKNTPIVSPSQLNVGLPVVEGVMKAVRRGGEVLSDILHRPIKDVSIKDAANLDPQTVAGWGSWIKSPFQLARTRKSIAKYQTFGRDFIAKKVQKGADYADSFQDIHKTLGSSLRNVLNSDYMNRKGTLSRIMIMGDKSQRTFNAAELKRMGADKEVIDAYHKTRKLMDNVHIEINVERKKHGLDPIKYEQGYVPHMFSDYRIIVDGRIIASVPTRLAAATMVRQMQKGGFKGKLVVKQQMRERMLRGISESSDLKLDDMHARMEEVMSETGGDLLKLDLEKKVKIGEGMRDFSFTHDRMDKSDFHGDVMDTVGEYLNEAATYTSLMDFKSKASAAFKEDYGDMSVPYEKGSVPSYIKRYVNDVSGGTRGFEEVLNHFFNASNDPFTKAIRATFGKNAPAKLASMGAEGASLAFFGAYNFSAPLINGLSLIQSAGVLGYKNVARGHKFARSKEGDKVMREIGVVKQSFLLQGSAPSKLTGVGRKLKQTMVLMGRSEYEARRASAGGAYLKAIDGGKSHAEAVAYSKEMLTHTMGDFSVANMPEFARMLGPNWGRLVFQFKAVPLHTVELFTRLAKDDRKALVKVFAPYMAITGAYGLPMSRDLAEMYNAIVSIATGEPGDIETDMKQYLMEMAGDDPTRQAVVRGINHGIAAVPKAGVDIASRFSVSSTVLSEPISQGGVMGSIPALSVIRKAAADYHEGGPAKMAKHFFKTFDNAAVLFDTQRVIKDWKGRTLLKLSTAQAGLKALGLSPAELSQARDIQDMERLESGRRSTRVPRASKAYAKAIESGDKEDIAKARKKLAELNIKPSDALRSVRESKEELPTRIRKRTSKRTEKGKSIRRIIENYGY